MQRDNVKQRLICVSFTDDEVVVMPSLFCEMQERDNLNAGYLKIET